MLCVHGRRPLDRPRGAAPARRAARSPDTATSRSARRLARGAHVTRSLRRELISRTYNRLLRLALRSRFSDAQCGFKAIRRDVATALLASDQATRNGSSTPSCSCSLNEPGCGSTRSRSTGWRTPTRASTCVATALADLRGVARLLVHRRSSPDSYIALTQTSDAGAMSVGLASPFPARSAGPASHASGADPRAQLGDA